MKRSPIILFTVALVLFVPGSTHRSLSLAYRQEAHGEIVFQSRRDVMGRDVQVYDLYIMAADGKNVRRLTKNEVRGSHAAWSPDGRWLAYSVGFAVYVMNPDDVTRQVVVPSEPPIIEACTPAWSPDSQQLALSSCAGDITFPMDSYLVNVDGSEFRPLTGTEDTVVKYPAWSSDGEKLAYLTIDRTFKHAIHVINLAEDSPAESYDVSKELVNMSDLAWAPDGRRIAFVIEQQLGLILLSQHEVQIIRFEDSDLNGSPPSWSPDGRQLVFSGSNNGRTELIVTDADGQNLHPLTDLPAFGWNPQWSPDGQWIAFDAVRDGNAEIYVIDVEGTDMRRLTHHQANDMYPIWRPVPQDVDE
jgi:Tol biopolymer transport system component